MKHGSEVMARLMRPLRQWPLMQHSHAAFHYLQCPSTIVATEFTSLHRLSFATSSSSRRLPAYRSRGFRLPSEAPPTDVDDGGTSTDSDSDGKKSRNQKKREARRAVRWGMELASFSTPQIKRILRVASLEREVFDALMLVKRLGPDVREGKRRQYNYIGKLLREVETELMDALIHATKDGDWSRLRPFSGAAVMELNTVDDEESDETENEDEEESHMHIDMATRWFDGLINRDIEVTNEVYAVSSVDFDRQELRRLVRRVHEVQEQKVTAAEENEQQVDASIKAAKKSLTRFLRALARQMPSESDDLHL